MVDIYKVTAATIKKTQNGYEQYNLQLDKSFWATKFLPLREIDKKWNPLYKLYVSNNNSLDFLVGRYIAITLQDSEFGKNFTSIASFDALEDFKALLDKSNGKAFQSNINIHGLLERLNFPLNPDMSITLREPYSQFNINNKNGTTICYPEKLDKGFLTLTNIGLIYDKFFKDKYIDNGNPDRDEKYAMTSVAIIMNRTIFHKSKSMVLSRDNFDVLRVGDRLSEEHNQFLSGVVSTGE